MEEVAALDRKSVKDNYKILRHQFAILSYYILCIRGCLGWIGFDTIILTLVLNLFIVLSIDYKHVNRLFLIVPFLVISMINNRTILGIIDIITMCLILKNVQIIRLAKIYFIILLLFVILWMLLLKTGYLTSHRWFDPAKGGESWDYGFVNPNGLGIMGYNICCMVYLLFNKKHILATAILTILISQTFYELSLCRTAWIGGIILALLILMRYFNLFNNWMKRPLAILPIIFFLFIIILVKKINSYEFLDILFSGRLSIWNGIMNSMGTINWIIGAYPTEIDGSFAMLLFMGGMVLVSIFCILFYQSIMCYFNLLITYLPFLLGTMACGMMETTFSSCGGLSVIFWFILINPKQIKSQNLNLYKHDS